MNKNFSFYNKLFEEYDNNNLKIEKHIKTVTHNSDNPDFSGTNIVIDIIYENNELNYKVIITILSGEMALSVKRRQDYESYKEEIKKLIEKYGYTLIEKTGNTFDSNKIAIRKKINLKFDKDFITAEEIEEKINKKIEQEQKNIDKLVNELIELQNNIIEIYKKYKEKIDLDDPESYVDFLKA